MTNDEITQFYAGYDDDDDDCGLDGFLDEIEDECETFEERLKRYDITLDGLRRKYAEFAAWYGEMTEHIGAECGQKAVVCRALCRYIRKNGADDDIMKFWCVCASEYYDNIFPDGYDKDEQSILFNFLALESDVQDFMFRIKNEEAAKNDFRSLRDNICFGEPIGEIDAHKLYHEFSFRFDINGPELENNLETVTSDICRSPQLYKAAPLVYCGLIMRQTRKMTDTAGYEPNYRAVFETKVRRIDKDNGKNISSVLAHIEVYRFFKEQLKGQFDEFFCDMGFSVMSNIPQCSLVSHDGITRQLYYQIRDEFFTAFPNGLFDNPVVVGADVHHDDVMNYECYDEKLPPKFRLLDRIRPFIVENECFSEEYLDLVAKNETDKCMPVVLSIFNGAGVESRFFKPDFMDIVYAVIMDELQNHISGSIQAELLEMIGIFMKGDAEI